jgi:hypothetical protein
VRSTLNRLACVTNGQITWSLKQHLMWQMHCCSMPSFQELVEQTSYINTLNTQRPDYAMNSTKTLSTLWHKCSFKYVFSVCNYGILHMQCTRKISSSYTQVNMVHNYIKVYKKLEISNCQPNLMTMQGHYHELTCISSQTLLWYKTRCLLSSHLYSLHNFIHVNLCNRMTNTILLNYINTHTIYT